METDPSGILKPALWIRLFISMRILIQGAKPIGIRILVKL